MSKKSSSILQVQHLQKLFKNLLLYIFFIISISVSCYTVDEMKKHYSQQLPDVEKVDFLVFERMTCNSTEKLVE
jgi:hypothetical protein